MCDVKAPFDGTLKFQKGSFPSLWRVGDGPFELADSPVPNSSAAPLPLPSHVGLAAAKPQAHGTGTATATQRRASPPPASSPADPRLLVPTSPAHGSQSRLLHAPHVALTASPARGTGRGDADAPQRGRTGRRGGAGRRTCTCTGDRPAGPHHAAAFPNFICSFRQESGLGRCRGLAFLCTERAPHPPARQRGRCTRREICDPPRRDAIKLGR
jgi:hypothetical protein